MTDEGSYGATVAKRKLARRLVALRHLAGMSLNEVSDKLGWNRGRLNRFEANQWRLPDASHVRDLARIYGASEQERGELEELVVRARARLWWHEPDKETNRIFSNEFAGFENDAARVSVYMPLVLPGLLQTEAYARAILAVGPWDERWRERALAARLRRRQILERADGTAPRLVAVITEASLQYQWGSVPDRRAQVAHLAAASRRPNVDLRMVRFAGRPASGHEQPDRHLRLPRRRRAQHRLPRERHRDPGGDQARRSQGLQVDLHPDPRRGPGPRRDQDLPRQPQPNPGVTAMTGPQRYPGHESHTATMGESTRWRAWPALA